METFRSRGSAGGMHVEVRLGDSINHMVNNRAVLIAKLKAGFVITGMTLDERYGAQVSLSYLFHADRQAGFERAFSLESYGDPAGSM